MFSAVMVHSFWCITKDLGYLGLWDLLRYQVPFLVNFLLLFRILNRKVAQSFLNQLRHEEACKSFNIKGVQGSWDHEGQLLQSWQQN